MSAASCTVDGRMMGDGGIASSSSIVMAGIRNVNMVVRGTASATSEGAGAVRGCGRTVRACREARATNGNGLLLVDFTVETEDRPAACPASSLSSMATGQDSARCCCAHVRKVMMVDNHLAYLYIFMHDLATSHWHTQVENIASPEPDSSVQPQHVKPEARVRVKVRSRAATTHLPKPAHCPTLFT